MERVLPLVPEGVATPDFWAKAARKNYRVLDKVPEHMRTEPLCLDALASALDGVEYVLPLVPEGVIPGPREHADETPMPRRAGLGQWPRGEDAAPRARERENTGLLGPNCLCEGRPGLRPGAREAGRGLLPQGREPARPTAVFGSVGAQDELCLAAVRNHGLALKEVPDNIKTANVCLEAVRQTGKAIRWLPQQFQSEAVYLEAIRHHGKALGDVLADMCTEAVCLAAVRQNGEALEQVPEDMRQPLLCYTAQVTNPQAVDVFFVASSERARPHGEGKSRDQRLSRIRLLAREDHSEKSHGSEQATVTQMHTTSQQCTIRPFHRSLP